VVPRSFHEHHQLNFAIDKRILQLQGANLEWKLDGLLLYKYAKRLENA
jgi:hypothetical protein